MLYENKISNRNRIFLQTKIINKLTIFAIPEAEQLFCVTSQECVHF